MPRWQDSLRGSKRTPFRSPILPYIPFLTHWPFRDHALVAMNLSPGIFPYVKPPLKTKTTLCAHSCSTIREAAVMKMKAFIVHRFKKRKLYSSNREANEILWAPSAMNVAKDRVCSCFAWMFLVSYPCYSFRHALYS